MKVKIIIDCEDTQEVISHLQVIISQIKKERKKYLDKEITKKTTIIDNNCYGIHHLTLKP